VPILKNQKWTFLFFIVSFFFTYIMMLDNKTTYETALGIYAMVPPAMLLALLKTDAPYGKDPTNYNNNSMLK
jgi:hypothetical protein